MKSKSTTMRRLVTVLLFNTALTAFLALSAGGAEAGNVGTFVQTNVSNYVDMAGDSTVLESCLSDPELQVPAATCGGTDSFAYAAMNTGTLTTSLAVPGDPFGGGAGYAEANIYDFLHFSGATSGQNVLITETGTGSATFPHGYGYLSLALSFSKDASSPISGFDVMTEAITLGGSGCSNPSDFPDLTLCKSSSGGAMSVSIDFPLADVDPTNGVFVVASDGCIDIAGVGNCNVNDPITITLPPGVTFSSSSGQFLTASPVPLPASVWLLLSALGGLALVVRRSRHTVGST